MIASHTLGVELDDGTIELAREISDAFEIPFVILATSHYLEKLTRTASSWNGEDGYCVTAADRDGPVEDIAHRPNHDDVLVLTTMGSRQRFADSSNRIPMALLNRISCSLLMMHRI